MLIPRAHRCRALAILAVAGTQGMWACAKLDPGPTEPIASGLDAAAIVASLPRQARAPEANGPGTTAVVARVGVGPAADAAWTLQSPRNAANPSIAIEARLLGALPVQAQRLGSYSVYPAAGPGAADVVNRWTLEGMEDYVRFRQAPSLPRVDYAIALGPTVAGLRLVSRTLEVLDSAGTPRLRIGPPYVLDADGESHEATMQLDGCLYDSDPRGPWGRPIVSPGARECTLSIAWGEIRYPAVLDPPWTTTGSMVSARRSHHALRLSDGRVLLFAGVSYGTVLSSAELYDPTTKTFSPTGAMSDARLGAATTLLADGRVLAAGGAVNGWALSSAEVYNPATGTWTTVGSLSKARSSMPAVLLTSGKVLVPGGDESVYQPVATVDLFDPATSAFTSANPMVTERAFHRAAAISGARVLVTAGYSELSKAEVYHESSGTFSPISSMHQGRQFAVMTPLPGGKVLFTAGRNPGPLKSSEVFDPATLTFSVVGALSMPRSNSAASALLTGGTLLTGGVSAVTEASAQYFDPVTLTWHDAGSLAVARAEHSSTALLDGTVLVAGGYGDSLTSFSSAELFALSGAGGPCSVPDLCMQGLSCVAGLCCDKPCTGACETCIASKGAAFDGHCTPLAPGHPGEPSCVGSVCDGAHASCPVSCASDSGCAQAWFCRSSDQTCQPDLNVGALCKSSTQCTSGFCVDSICCKTTCNAICQACSAAAKGGGLDGDCGTAKQGTDPHGDCADNGPASCLHNGLCDASGTCANYQVDTPCAPKACDGSARVVKTCKGAGECHETKEACDPFGCEGGVCKTACALHDDCDPGAWCNNAYCSPKIATGAPCTAPLSCESGLCVDGVCCNAPCEGICEACDMQGALGTCLAVQGNPHGAARGSCAPAPSGEPCLAAQCDGNERALCAGFVGSGVGCRKATCSGGTAVLAASCDGEGGCPQETKKCEPFACGATACLQACSVDAECAPGYGCELSTCVARAVCDGLHTVTSADGKLTDCAPYNCNIAGRCLSTCGSIDECVAPYVCSLAGACVAAAGTDSDSDGGCAIAPEPLRNPGGWLAWSALLGAALWGIRRRRSHPAWLAILGSTLLACGSEDSVGPQAQQGPELPAGQPSAAAVAALQRALGFRLRTAQPHGPPARAVGPGSGPVAVRDGFFTFSPAGDPRNSGPRVQLGFRASDPFRISWSDSFWVQARATRNPDTAGEVVDGFVVYPDEAPGAGAWVHRLTRSGTEDYMILERAPREGAIAYAIELGTAVAGLRLLSGTLEFLDAGGTPRLRVSAPYLVDSTGTARETTLELRGCAYDADPRGPWGRALTAPGSRHCELAIGWQAGAVQYPVLLDPSWTSAGTLVTGRMFAAGATLADGRVLIAGGDTSFGGTESSAELWDPATQTSSPTGSMSIARSSLTLTRLPQGTVVAIGGSLSVSSAELYNPASGTWAFTSGNMITARIAHTATLVASGDVLVAGGITGGLTLASQTELFKASGGVFQATNPLPTPREYHTATLLKSGRVLVAGGESTVPLADARTWDPGTGAWSPASSMSAGRSSHVAALLGDGRVLVAGSAAPYTPTAELYDPSSNSWAPTGSMVFPRGHAAATVVSPTRVLISGGTCNLVPETSEMYDAATGVFLPAGDMVWPRGYHLAFLLSPTAVAIATGWNNSEKSAIVEVWRAASQGQGCATYVQCEPGLSCSDGVCCDAPCTGACDACSKALGAVADGTCTVLPSGNPGTTSCAPFVCSGNLPGCPAACASDAQCVPHFWCDALSHACVSDLATGHSCTAGSQCQSGFCVEGVCCEGPCDGACQSCKASNKASGADGVCGKASAGLDPHETCPDDGAASCGRDGSCDGNGACRMHSATTQCAPPACESDHATGSLCNGSGSCVQGSQSCGDYGCKNGQCSTVCASSSDCAADSWCDLTTCKKASATGAVCTKDAQCLASHCVDGVCCNTACSGQCEACKEPGAVGTCVPIYGAPRPGREPCDPGAPADPCTARTCDGVDRQTCAGHPATATVCREASCQAGKAIIPARCDGSGKCPVPIAVDCLPYNCDLASCKLDCLQDTDCADGYRCAKSKCLRAATCSGTVLTTLEGQQVNCSPYACEADGTCRKDCASIDHCASTFVCDFTGKCTPSPVDSGESGGCSLHGVSREPRGGWAAAAAALAIALRRRRRQTR